MLSLCTCKAAATSGNWKKEKKKKQVTKPKSRPLQYLSGLEVNGLIHFSLRGCHQNKRCHVRKPVWKLSDCNSPLARGSINEWWRGINSQVCRRWITDAGKASCHVRQFTCFSHRFCRVSVPSNQPRSHFVQTTLNQSAVKGVFPVWTLSVRSASCSRFQTLVNKKSSTETSHSSGNPRETMGILGKLHYKWSSS